MYKYDMPAILSVCVDQYTYRRSSDGRAATGHHVHSIVSHFDSAARMPCLERSFAFDFGNMARQDDAPFNHDVFEDAGRSSHVSTYLAISRAISMPLSAEAYDSMQALHALTVHQPEALAIDFRRDAAMMDLGDLAPDDRITANCATFLRLLFGLAGLSPLVGRNDLGCLSRGSHLHGRLELINEDGHARLPGDLAQTFFTHGDSLYAYHNLDMRPGVVRFMDILATGLAALTARLGEDHIWDRPQPAVTSPDTLKLRDWLSCHMR